MGRAVRCATIVVVAEKSLPGPRARRWPWSARRRRWWIGVAALAAIAVVLVVAVLEGDLPEGFGDGVRIMARQLRHTGGAGAFGLLYLEESGIPMPMPGDVFVMYVGDHAQHTVPGLLVAWLALIAVVVLGATNLFFISRRWGRSLVEHRLANILHIGPAQMRRADRWFKDWGPMALIIGRHVPGLRVPLTVGAGIFGVSYPVFIVCVAISTAVWAGIFLVVGAAVGGRIGHLVALHHETYFLFPIAVVVVFLAWVTFLARHVGRDEEPASPEEKKAAGE